MDGGLGGIPGQIGSELKNVVKDVVKTVADVPKQILESATGGGGSSPQDQAGKQLEQGQSISDQQAQAAMQAMGGATSGDGGGAKQLEVEKRMREIRSRIQEIEGGITQARMEREQEEAQKKQQEEEEKMVKHQQKVQQVQKRRKWGAVDALQQELGGAHESSGTRKN